MMPGLVDDRLNQVPDFSIPDKEFANQDMLEAAGEEFIQMAALNKDSSRGAVPAPGGYRALQRRTVVFASLTALFVMAVTIGAMSVSGDYGLNAGTYLDIVTALVLLSALYLAIRDMHTNLRAFLVCIILPLNLFPMVVLDGQGAWLALLLLSATPLVWGALTRPVICAAYTGGLVLFLFAYVGVSGAFQIHAAGEDQSAVTAVILSVLSVALAVASSVPQHLMKTAYSKLEKALLDEASQRDRHAHYASMASDWHFEIGPDGEVIDFFGYADAVGRNWEDLLSDWAGDGFEFRKAVSRNQAFRDIKASLKIKDQLRYVEVSADPVTDRQGRFCGYRGTVRDVTERATAERQLRMMASSDLLTGLGNRHAFDRILKSGESECRPGAILYIDLDKFKDLNDRHGHSAGDEILRHVGHQISSADWPGISVQGFRLGGDEFCCIVEGVIDRQSLQELSESLALKIGASILNAGAELSITASVGGALRLENEPFQGTLERADMAVYEAKARGGGSIVIPDDEMVCAFERKSALRRDLLSAIANKDIEVVFQAIFQAKSRKLAGVKALARWNHPKFGLLTPADFMESARNSRDIIAFGQHVLEMACLQALNLCPGTQGGVQLHVNFCATEVLSPGFSASVVRILCRTGFPVQRLTIEIPEVSIGRNIGVPKPVFEELRGLGVKLVLDGFGSGHASLTHLGELKPDGIKVNRSLLEQGDAGQVPYAIGLPLRGGPPDILVRRFPRSGVHAATPSQ